MTFSVLVSFITASHRTEIRHIARQRGDIISVQSLDQRWGRRESLQEWISSGESAASFPSGYFVVRVTDGDTSPEDIFDEIVLPLRAESTLIPGEFETIDASPWTFHIEELSPEQLSQIQEHGVIDLTEAEFTSVCEHKNSRKKLDFSAPGLKGQVRPTPAQAQIPDTAVIPIGTPNG